MTNDLPFHVGSIIKYACRAGYKIYGEMNTAESEIADLRKVIRFCEMRINQVSEEGILWIRIEMPIDRLNSVWEQNRNI